VTEAAEVDAPRDLPADELGGEPPAEAARRTRPWDPAVRGENLFALACWLVVVTPLVVACLAAIHPRWYPIQDLAQYELRVRDVGGRHTPLIGLAGRIGPWYDPGSHPGPLSFWMLAPVYRLLGSSAAALVASAITLHSIAIGLVLWMAKRRGGVPLVAVVAGALAILTRFYGPNVFIEPWNPYLPVSWWLVLLFAVWSVLDGDAPMLVVAVVAGTFCAQTHLPYFGLVGGLVAVLLGGLGLGLWSARRSGDQALFGRWGRWGIGAAILGVLLWIPPIIDEIWGVGNLSRIRDSVTVKQCATVAIRGCTTDPIAGMKHGPAELLRNMDPFALRAHQDLTGLSSTSGINLPALVLIVVWLGAVGLAWRLGLKRVLRLHVVVGAALALAAFSSTRIYGLLWHYLFLWAWGLATVMLVAIAWTFASAIRPRLSASIASQLPRAAVGIGLAVAVAASAGYAVDNRDTRPARTDLSGELGVVSGELIRAIKSRQIEGDGPDGLYLVRWDDPVTIGSQGWGLVNELERAGLHGGFDKVYGVGGTKHRVIDPATKATAIVTIVVGDREIAKWSADTAATKVASVDLRTKAQRRAYGKQVDAIEQELVSKGLTKLARDWLVNAFTTSIDPTVPPPTAAEMRKVLAIPTPVALFIKSP
jgi:hypothetical protein